MYRKIDSVLEKYNDVIATAKSDIVCEQGTLFLKGSLICVEEKGYHIHTEEKELIDISLYIYDCSKMNELNKERKPYVKYDTLNFTVNSSEAIDEQIKNMFEINSKKTECQKEYAEIRQKTIDSIDNYDIIKDVGDLSNLFALILFFLATGTAKDICAVILTVCLLTPFVAKYVFVHKTQIFKKKADTLYSEIIK